jgi:glycine dehydrogenase
MLRYLHRLEGRDLALNRHDDPPRQLHDEAQRHHEMLPVSWPEFSALHPSLRRPGPGLRRELNDDLERMLSDMHRLRGHSLQPNAGSQGEYSRAAGDQALPREPGEEQRDICLIPSSAHGTNPASATMAGMRVVIVACDDDGNIDVDDLRRKAEEHANTSPPSW